MAKLFSYKMTHDSGFAPNPYHGWLTLATCKPGIRLTKKVGQWVAGFASNELVSKAKSHASNIPAEGLIYLMKISEVLPLQDYFNDPRFQSKKPAYNPDSAPDQIQDYGDNIYSHDDRNGWTWHQNRNHPSHHQQNDIKGRNVLISEEFYYLGRNCITPPESWESMGINVPHGPSYYGYSSELEAVERIINLLKEKGFSTGISGSPCLTMNKKYSEVTCKPIC